ncbi:FIST C-terminal domain-containing protein [Psychrosphaera sp.]|nr:FIST C-terminal domain-containing protein [Psychrosphaera sp.]
MKSNQYHYKNNVWQSSAALPNSSPAQLVLTFGNRKLMQDELFREQLTVAFPNAEIIGCTTSGEILNTEIYDETLVVNELEFESTKINCQSVSLDNFENFDAAISHLVNSLPIENLKHVLVISDGHNVNGTDLASQLMNLLPKDVTISGGLAGDGDRFQETIVWHNDQVGAKRIVLCGFYGDAIDIGYGSLGGWVPFGPQRLITKSKSNILYELDGQSALALYKEYLGEFASELPASALRFPLCLKYENNEDFTVRTILNIDEETSSLIFAGDMPTGQYVTLMRANTGKLVDGAQVAAEHSLEVAEDNEPDFALLISCVGRRLVLQQESEYELESVQEILGDFCKLSGFYSYGELSPMGVDNRCVLHNQTMTITTFKERV